MSLDTEETAGSRIYVLQVNGGVAEGMRGAAGRGDGSDVPVGIVGGLDHPAIGERLGPGLLAGGSISASQRSQRRPPFRPPFETAGSRIKAR
jgi:hypothetical protein